MFYTSNDIFIRFASKDFSAGEYSQIKDISEKGIQKIIENIRNGHYKSLYLSLNPDRETDGYKYFTMKQAWNGLNPVGNINTGSMV